MIDYRLYLVTGPYDFDEAQFLAIIEQAVKNGVTLVQLREKQGTTQAFYQRALKVKEITDRYQVPLIINDRVDICLAVDASGVHIGDDELPVSVVRQLIGKEKILGVSAKTVSRAEEAEKEGADYLGVGAIFPTATKDTSLTSMETLNEITQQTNLPVVAIGGIKEENLSQFQQINIDGFALVSEIMKAEDVAAKVNQLRTSIDNVLKGVETN
jgi:thiamine-phosphate pyrophosphorylase